MEYLITLSNPAHGQQIADKLTKAGFGEVSYWYEGEFDFRLKSGDGEFRRRFEKYVSEIKTRKKLTTGGIQTTYLADCKVH